MIARLRHGRAMAVAWAVVGAMSASACDPCLLAGRKQYISFYDASGNPLLPQEPEFRYRTQEFAAVVGRQGQIAAHVWEERTGDTGCSEPRRFLGAPSTGAPQEYRWSTSDSTVVAVSRNGVLFPRRPGKAAVRVVARSLVVDSVEINVLPPFSTLWAVPAQVTIEVERTAPVIVKAGDTSGTVVPNFSAVDAGVDLLVDSPGLVFLTAASNILDVNRFELSSRTVGVHTVEFVSNAVGAGDVRARLELTVRASP